jgi:hypothetical protein
MIITGVPCPRVTFGKIRVHALAVKVDVSDRIAVFLLLCLAVSGYVARKLQRFLGGFAF